MMNKVGYWARSCNGWDTASVPHFRNPLTARESILGKRKRPVRMLCRWFTQLLRFRLSQHVFPEPHGFDEALFTPKEREGVEVVIVQNPQCGFPFVRWKCNLPEQVLLRVLVRSVENRLMRLESPLFHIEGCTDCVVASLTEMPVMSLNVRAEVKNRRLSNQTSRAACETLAKGVDRSLLDSRGRVFTEREESSHKW